MFVMLTVTQNSVAFFFFIPLSHSLSLLSWSFSHLWVNKDRKENQREKKNKLGKKKKKKSKFSINSVTQGLKPTPITLLDLLIHLSCIDKCCRTPLRRAITASTPQALIGQNYEQPLISETQALSPHSNASPCKDKILSMPWAVVPLLSSCLSP